MCIYGYQVQLIDSAYRLRLFDESDFKNSFNELVKAYSAEYFGLPYSGPYPMFLQLFQYLFLMDGNL